MTAMESFLYIQGDYLLFLQGLAYIILGASCLTQTRTSRQEFPWALLGLFAAFRSLGIFLELPWPAFQHLLPKLHTSLVVISFFPLAEFARRGNKLPDGKTIGRWVVIPFIAVAVFGAIYNGWSGLGWAARYPLGSIGGFGAAVALFRQAYNLSSRPRLCLIGAGVCLILYVLGAGLAGAPADIDYDLTEHLLLYLPFGLPQPLFAGMLTLVLAFFISLHSLDTTAASVKFSNLYNKSLKYTVISITAMLAIMVGGWFATNYMGNYVLNELREKTKVDAAIMADYFGNLVRQVDQGAVTVSISDTVVDALTTRQNHKILAGAVILDRARWTSDADVCSIIDLKGKVVNSSDRFDENRENQFDLSLPFIRKALSGLRGVVFSHDQATAMPYYYSAYPIRSRKGSIIGAAIMKKGFQQDELRLKHHAHAFLVSLDGIIILTSQPPLRLMRLWPLDPKIKGIHIDTVAFGPGPFPALLPREPVDGQIAFRGTPHLAMTSFVGQVGLSIFVLESMSAVVWTRLLTIVMILFLSLLNLTFFIDNRRLLLSTARMVISEKRFHVIFQSVPSAIFIFDRTTGKTLAANHFASQWLGYTQEEFTGMTLRDIALSSAGEERNSQYQKKDGTIVDVEEIRSIITLEDRENLLVIAHDITERKMAAEQIGLAKEFSDSIVRTAKALIIGLDREGKIVLFNDHAEEITGWRREDALGRDWFSHFLPEGLAPEIKQIFTRSLQRYDPKENENRIITKAGVERIIAWNNTILRDGKGDVYLVLATGIDITERKKTEELLKHLSLMDGLTGIANRRHFDDFLLREWKRASREGAPLSLIMGDIDFFKGYNDSEGHQQGDICLQKVATALTNALKRPLDFVARYGGEEFVVVLPNTQEGGAAKIAETMRKNVENLCIPHTESQAGRVVTISLGVATARSFPDSSPDKLIDAADKALYRAKTDGRNRMAVSGSI